MNEVLEYLKANSIFYVATMDGDQPRVRPFGVVSEFEGKLYMITGHVKKVFEQIMKNPKIEISATGNNGTWIRIAATAMRDDRIEARQHFLDENPGLKGMYAADDGNCEVLYLKDATAVINSFGGDTKTFVF